MDVAGAANVRLDLHGDMLLNQRAGQDGELRANAFQTSSYRQVRGSPVCTPN
jgi:hypothetical protein